MEKYLKIILEHSYIQLGIYYFVISLICFVMMGKDKYAAKKNKWRVKEKTLFIISLLGGCLGGLLGMSVFRHKTQKVSFHFVFLISIIIHGVIIYLLFKNGFIY